MLRFAIVAIVLLAAGTVTAADPIFSIERNLVAGRQAARRQLTFRRDLLPLDAAAADTCHAVRPDGSTHLAHEDWSWSA